MSVINRMLQDLEQRKLDDPDDGFDAQIRSVPTRERHQSGWWAVVLLGGAMVVVGSLWLLRTPTNNSSEALRTPVPTLAMRPAPARAPVTDGGATVAVGINRVPPTPPVLAATPPTTFASVGQNQLAIPSTPEQLLSFQLKPTLTLDPAHLGASTAPVRAAPATSLRSAEKTATAAAPALSAENTTLPARGQAPATQVKAVATASTQSSEATLASSNGAVPNADARPTPTARAVKEITPRQRAENDYARALTLIADERPLEAIDVLNGVVQQEPGNFAARQSLVGLLMSAKRFSEAERALQDGLRLDRSQLPLAMLLARLQVEQGDTAAALKTLQMSAAAGADQAEYHGFLAALLQREGRHREAIEQYQQALRRVANSGIWLTGLGISLQAENRQTEAQEAFARAQASKSLSPELRAFVEQQQRQNPLH